MSSRHEHNGTVYYQYGDNSDLPVIIMIHGFRGTHHGLDLIAKPLDDYCAIVPDAPGFGESKPLIDEHSVANYVEWLKRFIDDLNLPKPPILLGHSFGSVIVAHYAVKYPSTIHRLILVNPIGASPLEGSKVIMTQMTLLYYWLARKLPEKTAYWLLTTKFIFPVVKKSLITTHDQSIINYIYGQHLAHSGAFANRKIVAETFNASIHNTVLDVAHAINVPTLLIAGELDTMTPLHKQYKMAKIMPNATLEIIKGVGHLTQYETPDEIIDKIRKFIG